MFSRRFRTEDDFFLNYIIPAALKDQEGKCEIFFRIPMRILKPTDLKLPKLIFSVIPILKQGDKVALLSTHEHKAPVSDDLYQPGSFMDRPCVTA